MTPLKKLISTQLCAQNLNSKVVLKKKVKPEPTWVCTVYSNFYQHIIIPWNPFPSFPLARTKNCLWSLDHHWNTSKGGRIWLNKNYSFITSKSFLIICCVWNLHYLGVSIKRKKEWKIKWATSNLGQMMACLYQVAQTCSLWMWGRVVCKWWN